jgi:hypothetical protein
MEEAPPPLSLRAFCALAPSFSAISRSTGMSSSVPVAGDAISGSVAVIWQRRAPGARRPPACAASDGDAAGSVTGSTAGTAKARRLFSPAFASLLRVGSATQSSRTAARIPAPRVSGRQGISSCECNFTLWRNFPVGKAILDYNNGRLARSSGATLLTQRCLRCCLSWRTSCPSPRLSKTARSRNLIFRRPTSPCPSTVLSQQEPSMHATCDNRSPPAASANTAAWWSIITSPCCKPCRPKNTAGS